jgi:hypothetical protein
MASLLCSAACRGRSQGRGTAASLSRFLGKVPSSGTRIADPQGGEPAEVAVGGPEFGHSVRQADRRDPGIVDSRASDVAGDDERRVSQ